MPTLRKLEILVLCLIPVLVSMIWLPPGAHAQTFSVTVTVTGFPQTYSTSLYIDGILNSTIRGGETKSFTFSATPPTTHTMIVDFYVPSASGVDGTRYYNRENAWSFSGPDAHTFAYKTQYYLNVTSPYATTGGSGWYDQGAAATATISTGEESGGTGIRYLFVGWTGDASGVDLKSSDIVMNSPKTAVAEWKTQYLLSIIADPSIPVSPKGTGWYDSGTTARFSVAAAVPSGTEGKQFAFESWRGDYRGTAPDGSLVMDGPKSLTARYKTQYLLAIKYTPAEIAQRVNVTREAWQDASSSVLLGPVPQIVPVSETERYMFVQWSDNGNPVPGFSLTIAMDQPHTVEIIYNTQFYLKVTSSYGQTFGTDWYNKGEKARFGISSSPSSFFVKYTLTSWRPTPSPASISRVSELEGEVLMDRPYLVEAQWTVDYTMLILLIVGLASVGVISIGGVVIAVKKPGPFARFRRRPPTPPAMPPALTGRCVSCNAPIARGATYCHVCGAQQVPPPSPAPPLDERVYDYIVSHEGVISLSQAARDLGATVDEIRASTERLKKEGKLG